MSKDQAIKESGNAKILVNGKTLREIATENDIDVRLVRNRYSRGVRKYEDLIDKPQRKKKFDVSEISERVLGVIYDRDITIADLVRSTKLPRSTITKFLYEGNDISCCRLAKICSSLDISADYVLGLPGRKR